MDTWNFAIRGMENVYLIKLGIADKMWIRRIARERNYEELLSIEDIWHFISCHLYNAGYESTILEKRYKEAREEDKMFADYMLKRYENSRQINQ